MEHAPYCRECGDHFSESPCKLHAAAPMLLEALEAVIPYAESYDPAEYGGTEPTQDADIDKARAVIQAAKGDA